MRSLWASDSSRRRGLSDFQDNAVPIEFVYLLRGVVYMFINVIAEPGIVSLADLQFRREPSEQLMVKGLARGPDRECVSVLRFKLITF